MFGRIYNVTQIWPSNKKLQTLNFQLQLLFGRHKLKPKPFRTLRVKTLPLPSWSRKKFHCVLVNDSKRTTWRETTDHSQYDAYHTRNCQKMAKV